MSEQNKEITSQSTFADFLYILGDVAAGKISFKEACKYLADKDRAKKLFETTKQAFTIIKSSIKERKQELDMQAKYDMSSAVKININENTSYMGVKPKQKKSWFKQMSENLGRTLKTTGSVLTGEKTIKQATKEEFQAVQESLSNSSNVYRGFRATAETISDFTKNIRELRGIETPKTELPKKETNPYDRLEPNQFDVAMHTAYTNIVRMEHFGQSMSDAEKDKALAEINHLMESAQKRFPDSKSEIKGNYFTNPKLQDAEAQLLAYMKSSEAKHGKSANDDMIKYDAWRQGKDFEMPTGNKTLSEMPYQNTELYLSSSTKDNDRLTNLFTAKDLRNPLEAGQRVMSAKDVAIAKAQLAKMTIR